jgi:serine/threonine protein kinase
LTTVGQLMGTLDYMAPEQADNSHDVDARADVYSLGATLFKLLTGTAPYETSERLSPLRKMKALATVDAPSLASRRENLPSEVVAITDRMLLRDPAARFATAKDVAEAVAPLCEGHRLAELTQECVVLRKGVVLEESVSPKLPVLESRRHSASDGNFNRSDTCRAGVRFRHSAQDRHRHTGH